MKQDPGIDRRTALATAASLVLAPCSFARPLQAGAPVFRPEQFGARGDGHSDDTAAFQALGRAVSEGGRGIVILRPGATYRVGRQAAGEGRAFMDRPMLRIAGANGLEIRGNGATLKLNDGLRYGSFDPASGRRFDPPPKGKFIRSTHAAAIGRMVDLVDCDNVRITGLTLDGNMDALVVGGRWGDVEIQLPATGLQLTRVSRVVVEDVTCRNNGLDGIYVLGRNTRPIGGEPDRIVFRNVRCDRNGRQGVSVVGGKDVRFQSCTFSATGQGPVASRPKSGVDVEPNGSDWATDIAFNSCTFINNRQVGLLADAGNSRGIAVGGCTFWQGFAGRAANGADGSGDALWITKEDAVIERCKIHGNITNLGPTTQVRASSFDDAVHPTLGRSAQRRQYLLQQAGGTFTDCSFAVTGGGGLGLVTAKPPLTLRGCRLHFAGQGMPAARAVAFFSPQTTLQDVTFTEGGRLGGRHYIYPGGARLAGRVAVTGPGIRWNHNGPIGNIAASPG